MDDRLTAPEQVGGYRVVRRIGRGGMSTIYLAENMHLRRPVALKVLDPELAENATFRQRFVQESQIVAALDHPHIVRVFDQRVLAERKLRLLYMQYVAGGSLHEALRRLADTPPAQRSGRALLDAVDAALAGRGE